MKKKGFTLIELLAVIVVLAIIALIATPIVMKLISNAQEGANARSVEGYMKAYEAAYYQYMLENGGRRPEPSTISSVDYSGAKVVCEVKVTDGKFSARCSIDGQDGTYSYANGKATKIGSGSVAGTSPDQSVAINPNDYIIDTTAGKICKLVDGYTAYEIGSAYVCNPGDNINRVFYVLDNSDATNISLIMDRNYDNTTQPWCDQQGHNPDNNICNADGLTSKLDEIRDNWLNISSAQIVLPTYDQIYNVNNSWDLNSTPWLYGNLHSDSNTSLPYGYWTSSASLDDSDVAWHVHNGGFFGVGFVGGISGDGVRPVITVSKSSIGL